MSEKYTYVGRRLQKGKLQHCFQEEGKKGLVWWPKMKASVVAGARIGRTYKIGDRFPSLWSEAEVSQVSDDVATEWQALDRAAYLGSQELKQSPVPELDAAISALARARMQMPASRRGYFDGWLINQIHGYRG